MNIVINCQQQPGLGTAAGQQYISEIFCRLVTNYPQHCYIFLGNVANLPQLPNIKKPVTAVYNNTLLLAGWHYFSLPKILIKHSADILINAGGYTCKAAKLGQITLLTELHYKRNAKLYNLREADILLMPFLWSDNWFLNNIQFGQAKVQETGMGINPVFKPLTSLEIQAIKEEYTSGREYFFSPVLQGAEDTIVFLLKAFSSFKKLQQSNMLLVLAGATQWIIPSIRQKLESYKYRNDVLLIENMPDDKVAGLMGAAYAMACPVNFQGNVLPILQALACGLPILAPVGNIEKVIGEAGVFTNIDKPEAFAEKLMLLYKNEYLRNHAAKAALENARNYSWQKSADKVWQAIETVLKKEAQ